MARVLIWGAATLAVLALAESARVSGALEPLLALPVVAAAVIAAWRTVVADTICGLSLASGGWRVRLADGRALSAQPVGAAFVTPWVVVVSVRIEAIGGRELCVFRDAVDEAAFRRLARAARWHRQREP